MHNHLTWLWGTIQSSNQFFLLPFFGLSKSLFCHVNGLRYQVRRTCNPYSPFALKFNFWPFTPIGACFWATPQPYLPHLLTKILSLDTVAILYMERKLFQAIPTPLTIVSPSPAICLKIQFFAIYPHLRLLMGNPLTTPPLLLTKILSLDAVAILYMERKLFQAVSTPLSRHLLPFAWKNNFWPFTPICACLWETPWSHLHFD